MRRRSASGGLLLMAHPRAQPAEALVDLDHWVRGGGRLLLLADPMLEWPSERPLGDPLRPPPAFADTGLLKHWGLRLDAPDERGPGSAHARRTDDLTVSPGSLVGAMRDQQRSAGRAMPHRQGPGDDRRRRRFPRCR